MKKNHRTNEKEILFQYLQQEIGEKNQAIEESEMEQKLLSESFNPDEIEFKAIEPIRLVNPKDNI